MMDLHVVSASSSFLRFIRSLSASASRRAICIFCWIDSALASAMPSGTADGCNCYRKTVCVEQVLVSVLQTSDRLGGELWWWAVAPPRCVRGNAPEGGGSKSWRVADQLQAHIDD